MLDLHDYLKVIIALISVVDPLGAIPVFLGVSGTEVKTHKRLIWISTTTALVILVLSIFAGEFILEFFGISMAAFRVSGGLLVLLMGFDLLNTRKSRTKQTPEEVEETQSTDEFGVVPLGIPLLAGPGAISTLIVYSNHQSGITHDFILSSIVLGVIILTLIVLRLGRPLANILGKTGMNVVSRLMGLILIAIGVEFIAQGVGQLFPGLIG